MTNGQRMSRSVVRFAETLAILASCAAYFALDAKAAPTIPETEIEPHMGQFGENLSAAKPTIDEIMSTASTLIDNIQSSTEMKATDVDTSRLETLPKLDVNGTVRPTTGGRSKRYVVHGGKWLRKNLTYKISSYPSKGLERRDVDREIARAFDTWSDYTDFTFTPTKSEADIDIKFVCGDHGDGHPFDESSGVKAHANFASPPSASYIHFNDKERWTMDSYRGINLFQFTLANIGYILGLANSDIDGVAVSQFYEGYEPYFTLHEDDIMGIRAIYGPKLVQDVPQLCDDPEIDGVIRSDDNNFYIFRGKYYWEINDDGIVAGYPKIIVDKWRGLPANIDVVSRNGSVTIFAKGSKKWKYVDDQLIREIPIDRSGNSARDWQSVFRNYEQLAWASMRLMCSIWNATAIL